MSRYIDADALFEELQRCSHETWSKDINRAWWAQAVKIKDNIVRCIDRQPTADVVEVRHGEWVDNHCSVCGMQPIGEETWTSFGLTPPIFKYWLSFCPCCGAKMSDVIERSNENV